LPALVVLPDEIGGDRVMGGVLLLTFDLEEFDWPVERGRSLDLEAQLRVTTDGLARLAPVLASHGVRVTFFTTASFAAARPEVVRALARGGHEIAAHGLSHLDDYQTMDEDRAVASLQRARHILESIVERPVLGFRAPRLRAGSLAVVRAAGYRYGANVHPTWVPGRYCQITAPRRPWLEDGVIRIPISVAPWCRWPLSFLWFRFNGVAVTTLASRLALRDTGYLCLYFHPWEAMPIGRYGIPPWLAFRTGEPFVRMMDRFLAWTRPLEKLSLGPYAERLAPHLD
jgi:peptidoglycan/xylan/chitin deacetylase (PgdA/CDA1 family)